MFSLLFLLAFFPSSEPYRVQYAEVSTGTRRAELSHLKSLLNTNIEGDSPKPAPHEIVRTLDKYIPYAGLSYCPDDSVKKLSCNHCKRVTSNFTPQFHSFTSSPAAKTHAVILVDKQQKEIIVSFRGSEDFWKVLSLAFVMTVPYEIAGLDGAKVDGEVLDYLDKIIGDITTELIFLTEKYPDFVIVLVGHSLGGSLATLAAPVLYKELNLTPDRMLVMSYGQPKVANQVFVDYFETFGFPYMRIVNEDDWITQSLKGPNLAHTNNEIYFKHGTALQCRKNDSKCSLPLTFYFSYRQHSKIGDKIVGSGGC